MSMEVVQPLGWESLPNELMKRISQPPFTIDQHINACHERICNVAMRSESTQGMHHLINLQVKWNNDLDINNCSPKLTQSYSSKEDALPKSILILFLIPSGAYVDPIELSTRHNFNRRAILIHTVKASIDPEAMSSKSNPYWLGVEFFNIHDDSFQFTIPVHIRYHPPSNDTKIKHLNVRIPRPWIYYSYTEIDSIYIKKLFEIYNIHHIYDKTHLGNIKTKNILFQDLKNFKLQFIPDKYNNKFDGNDSIISDNSDNYIDFSMPIGQLSHSDLVVFTNKIVVYCSTIFLILIILFYKNK